jgi:hypothetical protein
VTDDRLLTAVNRFLDDNYPCRCGDGECPGNYYESIEIVEMVRPFLLANVPKYWGAQDE